MERDARRTFASRNRTAFAPPPVRSRRAEIFDTAAVVLGSGFGIYRLIRGETLRLTDWIALGVAASFLIDILYYRIRSIWSDPVEPSRRPRP